MANSYDISWSHRNQLLPPLWRWDYDAILSVYTLRHSEAAYWKASPNGPVLNTKYRRAYVQRNFAKDVAEARLGDSETLHYFKDINEAADACEVYCFLLGV